MFFDKYNFKIIIMNNGKRQPWYGLDDLGGEALSSGSGTTEDPNPGYNKKAQREQDPAVDNPELSIDKDEEQPWVQKNEGSSRDHEIGVNEVEDWENNDPPIDELAQPENREDIPKTR